jgi:hypothetical protein
VGGGEGFAGLLTQQNRNLKNRGLAHIMIQKVLNDFPGSQNQPLKSADDYYIRIF